MGIVDSVKVKWDDLSLIEIEKASNIPEAELAANGTRFNGEVAKKAYSHWAKLCQTFSEIKYLKDSIALADGQRKHLSDEIKGIVNQRLESILFVEVPRCTDIELAKLYYRYAPDGSSVRILAFKKWLSLCKTPEEADQAYKTVKSQRIEVCAILAYRRVEEITSLTN
jgi:hypothetical protein